VESLAQQLSAEARPGFGRACLAQCDWLGARGLDSASLPGVDGEVSYIVLMAGRPGSCAPRGTAALRVTDRDLGAGNRPPDPGRTRRNYVSSRDEAAVLGRLQKTCQTKKLIILPPAI